MICCNRLIDLQDCTYHFFKFRGHIQIAQWCFNYNLGLGTVTSSIFSIWLKWWRDLTGWLTLCHLQASVGACTRISQLKMFAHGFWPCLARLRGHGFPVHCHWLSEYLDRYPADALQKWSQLHQERSYWKLGEQRTGLLDAPYWMVALAVWWLQGAVPFVKSNTECQAKCFVMFWFDNSLLKIGF